MRFKDSFVNHSERFSLGVELESGRRYIAIAVSNRLVDYEEYYELTPKEYQDCLQSETAAVGFARRCTARELDSRLMVQPGTDRGVSS